MDTLEHIRTLDRVQEVITMQNTLAVWYHMLHIHLGDLSAFSSSSKASFRTMPQLMLVQWLMEASLSLYSNLGYPKSSIIIFQR